MKSVIVGTAGHIDHGKTTLIKALTGIDADRLEEEKRRGITIDLGFAHLRLPLANGDTVRLGFVDVPGHERFVRNMLAGVGGIDLVLFVIAADEGIMPQTREHFDICRLLNVRRGITVLTKCDSVDTDTLEVVRLEVEDFLRGSFLDPALSPLLAVSSLTGTGLDQLKSALVAVAGETTARDSNAIARLPIDRVFTMKGFGTVVTGTLIAGTIRKEEELEVFPTGKRVRVRGLQVHGAIAEQAIAGQRTALNLAGASTEELGRGMTLAPPDTFRSTLGLDVRLSLLPSAPALKDRARLHFHAHTMESIAEVRRYATKQLQSDGEPFAQLRLRKPALLLPGDRFILRQFSPLVTIGGGTVIDAMPLRKSDRREAFLGLLMQGNEDATLSARVARRGQEGISLSQLVAETGWPGAQLEGRLSQPIQRGDIVRAGEFFVHAPAIEDLGCSLVAIVDKFHQANPLVVGVSKEELREAVHVSPEVLAIVLDRLLREKKIALTGELAHVPGRGVVMKDEEAESKKMIERAFASAGLKVPSLKEVLAGLTVDKARAQKIVTLLLRDKILIKISEDLVFHQSALAHLRHQVAALKAGTPKIDVARFKDLTGVSRKYAIPLLEYLDRERVTRRVGDERVIL